MPYDEETNDGKGWCVAIQVCWYCSYRQVAVYPADASVDQFECARCGLMTAVDSDDPADIAAVRGEV